MLVDGWRADLDAPAVADGGPSPARRSRRVLPAAAVLIGAAVLAGGGALVLDAAQPGCAELLRGPAGREYLRVLGGAAAGRDAAEAGRVCGPPRAPGLVVTSVAVDGTDPRWLVATTSLRSTTPMALSVTAVDVADVAAVAMADGTVLAPGGRGEVEVRVPVRVCAHDEDAAGVPSQWDWSLGPAGSDPAAIVRTPLPVAVRERLGAALRDRCGPAPTVTAVVTGAEVVPDPGPRDRQARSVRLALTVTSGAAASVVLGDSPTGLTADARTRFTAAAVPPGGPTRVEVVWRTRCGAAAPAALPATARTDGVDHRWSVPLDAGRAERALARSC